MKRANLLAVAAVLTVAIILVIARNSFRVVDQKTANALTETTGAAAKASQDITDALKLGKALEDFDPHK